MECLEREWHMQYNLRQGQTGMMNKKCRLISYRKLVETFHSTSECKPAVYFDWWIALHLYVVQVIVNVNPLALLYSWQTESYT